MKDTRKVTSIAFGVVLTAILSAGFRYEQMPIGRFSNIYLYNDLLLISDEHYGIHVYSVADKGNPFLRVQIPLSGNTGCAMKDNVIYANSYDGILALTIDADGSWDTAKVIRNRSECCMGNDIIERPSFPLFACRGPVAYEDVSSGGGTGGSYAVFAVIDTFLYYLDYSEIVTMSIRDPADPVELTRTYVDWGAETLFPTGRFLFVGGSQGMYVMDRGDPRQPVLIAAMQHWQSCDPVVVEGDYAYVTLRSGNTCGTSRDALLVVDIKNPEQPTLVCDKAIATPYGLTVRDSLLYVSNGYGGFTLFDISKPASPQALERWTDKDTKDFIWDNDVLYVMAFTEVRLSDVGVAAPPVAIATIDLGGFAARITSGSGQRRAFHETPLQGRIHVARPDVLNESDVCPGSAYNIASRRTSRDGVCGIDNGKSAGGMSRGRGAVLSPGQTEGRGMAETSGLSTHGKIQLGSCDRREALSQGRGAEHNTRIGLSLFRHHPLIHPRLVESLYPHVVVLVLIFGVEKLFAARDSGGYRGGRHTAAVGIPAVRVHCILAPRALQSADHVSRPLDRHNHIQGAVKHPYGHVRDHMRLARVGCTAHDDCRGEDAGKPGHNVPRCESAYRETGNVDTIGVDRELPRERINQLHHRGQFRRQGVVVLVVAVGHPAETGPGSVGVLGRRNEAGLFGLVRVFGPYLGNPVLFDVDYVVGTIFAYAVESDDEGIDFRCCVAGRDKEAIVESDTAVSGMLPVFEHIGGAAEALFRGAYKHRPRKSQRVPPSRVLGHGKAFLLRHVPNVSVPKQSGS